MKKILLLCLACCLTLCVIIISCSKTVKIPLSYSVTDSTGAKIHDIYIPDSGTFVFPVWVKFLTGYAGDKVTISFSGLPADVKVTPDSFSAIPTYTERFVFYTNHAVHATYPITARAYTPTSGYKYFNFNLGVIPANCSSAFLGTLAGRNACGTSGKYQFTATGVAGPYNNTMKVNNFGGYGPNVNVLVYLDCRTDSAFIPYGDYGNFVKMQGQGTFTGNRLIIYYNATSTPGGFPDNCIDTLTVAP